MKKIVSIVLILAVVVTLMPMSISAALAVKDILPTVSLGETHSAAIKTDGSLWIWGRNYYGELGDGTNEHKKTPVKIMDNVASVSLGRCFSAAIKTDGSLWTWGMNYYGELGDGTTSGRTTPVKIMDNVVSASLGNAFAAAIKTDGSLWIWGRNSYGQLGNGTTNNSSVPIKIMDNVVSVSLGEFHSAAIKTDGSLWTWGDNLDGKLGDGTTSGRTTPVKIMDNVASVSLGGAHSAAIKTDGSLWTWGDGNSCALGDGVNSDRSRPIKIMDNVVSASLGGAHSAAIKTDGSLWIWGWNSYGRLGNGTTNNSSVPIKIMDNVASVSLGDQHSAAIKTDGSLWTWGYNLDGKLGDGTNEHRKTPVKIMSLNAGLVVEGKNAVQKDKEIILKAIRYDENGNIAPEGGITWSCSDESIVQVTSSGNNVAVKGLKEGKVTITATHAEIVQKANFEIEVVTYKMSFAGGYTYVLDADGNAVVTSIIESDESGTVSIPTEIDGYKVVAIDGYCIPDDANIKRITIPSTITHIDENAFNGYDGIEIIYYFSTEDEWLEITDGIHYVSDDTEIVYVMDNIENTEISDYSKPKKKKDSKTNFTEAIRDWEREKNDWIDTLVKVVNNIKDDISVSNEDSINNNYEKNKDKVDAMIADEGWYQSGADGAREAAFRAVYDMIANWGEESLSLDKVDPSSDVVDFSTRIVKNVINGMKNQTIEKDYGDYTVLITVSGINTGLFENPAFTGSVTVKYKNGKTFGPALINSTVDDTKQVMSDYMLQLKELEENTVEMALETYVSDLVSLTDSNLPLDAIKEKLDSTSKEINKVLEEKGLGNLNNFVGGIVDVIKCVKEVIELQDSGDTDALVRAVADLDSKLDFLSGESTTATSATLDWAYRNLKQKTKYLKEVTEAYIDGKEIPEYETTLDKIVGWFDKHIFQCPIDVYVYNENDELIGCVSDEQIFGDTDEIYVEKNGDTKTVYVAQGADVHFILVGTDVGNLDYVSETYSENKVVGRNNFYGIELYDGKEITAEVTDETAPNDCREITLKSNSETINTTEYIKATDNASVLIESNIVGDGTVIGAGWYARGDSVTLVAVPSEGYVFKGWYDGDTPITFNANYTFCAKDFAEITAKFEKYIENHTISIPVNEGFKIMYEISAESDESNVYVYVKGLSEEADLSNLNLYLAEYETSGKLSTLTIANTKADEEKTMVFTIPYPQLENFKIMLWTNNITPVIDVLN